jgi:hypothetical protein
VDCLMDNKYETTIFVITSGVMKLSKITKIPEGRRLYRGLSGMILPRQFWESFEECVVTVVVVDTNRIPGDIVQHIMGFTVPTESVSKDIALEIDNTYLALRIPLMGDMKVRVIQKPKSMKKATSRVRLVLALPWSKSDFNEKRSEFEEALLNMCGKEGGVTIKIERIVGKNREFQGGGKLNSCPKIHAIRFFSLQHALP